MVTPRVNGHIGGLGHVALYAAGASRPLLVTMVAGHIVFPSRVSMTRGAQLVGVVLDFGGMGIMTVSAANSLVIHFALQERSININLVLNLAIVMIGLFTEQFIGIEIVKSLPTAKPFLNPSSAGMAFGTGFNLGRGIFAFKPGQSVPLFPVPE